MNNKGTNLRNDLKAIIILLLLNIIFFIPIILRKGFLWEDFLYQNYPYRIFSATAFHGKAFPFWNPYVFGGLPFFADVQAGVLYPFSILTGLLAGGKSLSYYSVEMLAIFHIFMAGSFMYILLRELNLNWRIGVLGALIYMLNFRFISDLTHLNRIMTFAWFPLIFLLYKRGIDKLSIKFAIGCGLTSGIVAFAGYPQALIIIWLFLFYYFIYRLVVDTKNWKRIFVYTLISLSIFGVISSWQYLPTYQLLKYTPRIDYTYQQITEGSFNPIKMITFLLPNFFGSMAGREPNYYYPASVYFFWEQRCYMGIYPLFFIFFSFSRKWKKFWIFLLASSLFSLLFAFGKYFFLHRLLYISIPIFKIIRTPPIHLNILVFGFSIMSALGLNRLWENKANVNRETLVGIMLGGIVFSILLLQFVPSHIGAKTSEIVHNNIWRFLILILILGVIFILYNLKFITGNQLLLLLGTGIFIDVFFTSAFYNVGKTPPEKFWGENIFIKSIRHRQGRELTRLAHRTVEGRLLLPRNVGLVHRIFTTAGYNPMILERYSELRSRLREINLNRWYQIANVNLAAHYNPQSGFEIKRIESYLPRVHLFYNYQIEKDISRAIESLGDNDFDPWRVVILEEEPPINIDPTGKGNATIQKYNLNRIVTNVNTRGNAILFFSENYYPQWIATIDGKKANIVAANVAFRAVIVPAGKHRVILEYHEVLFIPLMLISLTTIIACISFILYRTRKPESKIQS